MKIIGIVLTILGGCIFCAGVIGFAGVIYCDNNDILHSADEIRRDGLIALQAMMGGLLVSFIGLLSTYSSNEIPLWSEEDGWQPVPVECMEMRRRDRREAAGLIENILMRLNRPTEKRESDRDALRFVGLRRLADIEQAVGLGDEKTRARLLDALG